MLAFGIAGLATGAGYALLGLALTITYQTTRTVNFAAAAVGATGTLVFGALAAGGVPYLPALALGVLAGAAVSMAMGWVLTIWFEGAAVGTRSVVSIGVLTLMTAVASLLFGGDPQPVPRSSLGEAFSIGGAAVTRPTVLLIGLAVVVVVVLTVVLRTTWVGKRLQAVSERAATAELLGIPARRYGLAVWAGGGALAVVAVTLVSESSTTDFLTLSLLVVPALAAALFGLFRSMTATVAGGLGLGVLQGLVTGVPAVAAYSTTAPFFALLVVLVLTQRGQRWEDAR